MFLRTMETLAEGSGPARTPGSTCSTRWTWAFKEQGPEALTFHTRVKTVAIHSGGDRNE
jgi:hypothetical protein